MAVNETDEPDRRRHWRITDDLAEYRAYLQRGETRLSTLHRVAGAFLGGAGLLTLLPVLFRDTFSALFAQLVLLDSPALPSPGAIQRWLLLVPVVLSLLLPLAALYLLIRDLVQFYFTGHHFGDRPSAVTYPRFILSGILTPDNHLHYQQAIKDARDEPAVTDLLVPESARARLRLFREAHVLGQLKNIDEYSDRELATDALKSFLFSYTASRQRTLAQESAKMEASLARHHALLRVLVLRYAKAFLLTILTTCSTVTSLVILNLLRKETREELVGVGVDFPLPNSLIWIGVLSVYAVWCLAAVWVVRRPVVWIYKELGGSTRVMRTPQSLLQFERWTLAAVLLGAATTATCLWWFAVDAKEASIFWLAGLITATVSIVTIALASYTIIATLTASKVPSIAPPMGV